MSKRVLIITNHRPGRSPAQRFRFEQYLPYLESKGFSFTFSNIIGEKDDKILYQKGRYLAKAKIAAKALKIRRKNVQEADKYDLVFIHREALLTSSTKFERAFSQSLAKVVFDFDDAIWLPNVSSGNRALQKLKKPQKVNTILQYVDMVFAGNDFLADYARRYVKDVKVIPTTIDTSYHVRKNFFDRDQICIGWTGTETTRRYLNDLTPVLKRLKSKYGDQIYFKIICDKPWQVDGLDVLNERWNKQTEISQLEEIDIGLMPLTDDEWSRGKCGFKGLQYMAMESVPVLSPVGVNNEIIDHGVNGYLAKSEEDWERSLSLLIEDKELRERLGKEARKTILEKYSVNVYQDKYLEYFNELINKNNSNI